MTQRACWLDVENTVNTRRFEGFRTRFVAKYTAKVGGSTCSIGLWNPPLELVQRLGEVGAEARLYAGDVGAAREVSRGRVVAASIRDQRSAAEPRVEFETTGSSPLTYGRLSLSMPGESTTTEAIEAIRAELGIPADVIEVGQDVVARRGRVFQGSPRQALEQLARESGSSMDIVDGRLRVWPRGSVARRTADLWTAATGLLEVVPQADGLIQATALLRPEMRCGDLVELDGRFYQGEMAATEATHTGDTHADDWTTTVLGRPQ